MMELKLRAKYNVHIIAIKELVPENFLRIPPANFVIKDSDILIMLGKTHDIIKIMADVRIIMVQSEVLNCRRLYR
jgi:trk system potassium uptake protein TrkA